MYCEKCGHKKHEAEKFCTQCGNQLSEVAQSLPEEMTAINQSTIIEDRWWLRLLKVAYIFLCLQILWIVPLVWSINSTTYVGGYYSTYKDTPETAFWYSVLTIIIYMAITRLLKISVLYIATGKKPNWGKEFRKFY